ncbi:MAG: methylenetetrahydrofolate--tRNA-(uracil(54)-C(5))-methyltransferase (FADH(2)-oxidizing) TrmFO [Gemmatimonadales bacterium]
MKARVIGGGLAGSEAAWQLAQRGHDVSLYEMRPAVGTPAHKTEALAEVVCTNSFKSTDVTNAHGLLKAELRILESLLLDIAERTRIPGGTALVVDRKEFSRLVTESIENHPKVEVVRAEVSAIEPNTIVATGPLTSDAMSHAISERLGTDSLAFFDAIAPIVSAESLDHEMLFAQSRYDKGDGADYLNAPLDEKRYNEFIDALISGDQFAGHDFDSVPYFEGCLPIEEMASRGRDTLRFGPMKPVGLTDPRTGKRPYAVVQLRREDREGQMWNLVGFQTRLRIPEQKRIFGTIPGFADVEYYRFGSIHRNTYLNSPAALSDHATLRDDSSVFFAGQLIGVEGYTESLASGLLAGINLARVLDGLEARVPPRETVLGALLHYVRSGDPARFQPMNANFGLLPPLDEPVRDKKLRKSRLAERALARMEQFAVGLAAVAA